MTSPALERAPSALPEWLPRALPLVFLLLCAIGAPSWPRSFLAHGLPADFSVFWAAAQLGLHAPHLIYDDAAVTLQQVGAIGAVTAVRPWAYPPTALLPLLPLGTLPYLPALILFVGLTLALFLFAARPLFPRRAPLAFGLVVLSQPAIFAALNGQMVFLVGALVIAALVQLPNAPARAGALLGIAAALKPQLLVFTPLALIAGRDYRALGSAMVAGVAMIFASLLLGPERWPEWLAALARFKGTVESLDILYRNVTPTGILWFLGVTGPGQWIANLVFALIGGGIVWRVFRATADVPTRLVALVGGALFAAPYAMNYDLVLLVPAVAALLVRAPDEGASQFPALAGGLLLVSNGVMTPAAAMLCIALVVKPFVWPNRAAINSVSCPRPLAAPAAP